ncbi:MAG: Hsp20 family protein [Rhodospirillales bacterium]|nr:Hsp20 family protein [Rhodospirillales bacterium]
MSKASYFQSPLLLGFERFERLLESVAKSANDGYPPYDIEHLGEDRLRITLAVSGFGKTDLSASVEDNKLIVEGQQADESSRNYLHRGIAARQFQRSFVLAEGLRVLGANLDNGLLHIDLIQPKPDREVRRIEISDLADGEPAGFAEV